MKLLAIDTATEQCSVALIYDGSLSSRDAPPGTAHSAAVLRLIAELLADAGCTLERLDAIAFGRGPGAFTGVRLAASVTQGLAFAAGLPVLPVSDLQALAQRVIELPEPPEQVLVCQDARLGELYCAYFARRLDSVEPLGGERLCKPAAIVLPSTAASGSGRGASIWGAGSGFAAYPELQREFVPGLARYLPGWLPHARQVATLAVRMGLAVAVPPEQALPVYLRDDVARPRAEASAATDIKVSHL